MNLALAIVLLWTGAALLFVAFHPLQVEQGQAGPHQVLHSLQASVVGQTSAYS